MVKVPGKDTWIQVSLVDGWHCPLSIWIIGAILNILQRSPGNSAGILSRVLHVMNNAIIIFQLVNR
jgi:hypothetical protein